MIKYCRICAKKYETVLAEAPSLKYCTVCSGGLREVRVEEYGEIFIESIQEDNIMADGVHLGCGACTEKRKTSVKGVFVHVCRGCFCRIYEREEG